MVLIAWFAEFPPTTNKKRLRTVVQVHTIKFVGCWIYKKIFQRGLCCFPSLSGKKPSSQALLSDEGSVLSTNNSDAFLQVSADLDHPKKKQLNNQIVSESRWKTGEAQGFKVRWDCAAGEARAMFAENQNRGKFNAGDESYGRKEYDGHDEHCPNDCHYNDKFTWRLIAAEK